MHRSATFGPGGDGRDPGRLVDAVLLHVADERLAQRRRGRDRVPRAHRCAAIHRTEADGVVALDEDAIANAVGLPTGATDDQVAQAVKGASPELLAQKDIDGGLIGGASLEARSFVELVNAAAAVA